MISKGFIYRLGIFIKEIGERIGHVKIGRIFIFNWLSNRIIKKGLTIKDSVLGNTPISEL